MSLNGPEDEDMEYGNPAEKMALDLMSSDLPDYCYNWDDAGLGHNDND